MVRGSSNHVTPKKKSLATIEYPGTFQSRSLADSTFNAHEKNSSPPSNIPTILPNRESTPDFNNLNARQQAEVTAMRGIRDSYSKLLNEQKRNRRNDLLEARRGGLNFIKSGTQNVRFG